jgi:hypothetical protein
MPASTLCTTVSGALSILYGDPVPGETSSERMLNTLCAWDLMMRERLDTDASAITRLSPEDWGRLARTNMRLPDCCVSYLPAWRNIVPWIASAPPEHLSMALAWSAWTAPMGSLYEEHVARLLAGEAGPAARAALPGCMLRLESTLRALMRMPKDEVRALVEPHTAGWAAFTDRALAHSDLWTDQAGLGTQPLWSDLSALAGAPAAVSALSRPLRCPAADVIPFAAVVPPSGAIVDLVARHGPPDMVRELYATLLTQRLPCSLSEPHGDPTPSPEPI